MYGSMALGLGLILSTRRYLPNLKALSVPRMTMDVFLLFTPMCYTFYNIATPEYLSGVKKVRKNLIFRSNFSFKNQFQKSLHLYWRIFSAGQVDETKIMPLF
jgi:hypothetical protein